MARGPLDLEAASDGDIVMQMARAEAVHLALDRDRARPCRAGGAAHGIAALHRSPCRGQGEHEELTGGKAEGKLSAVGILEAEALDGGRLADDRGDPEI